MVLICVFDVQRLCRRAAQLLQDALRQRRLGWNLLAKYGNRANMRHAFGNTIESCRECDFAGTAKSEGWDDAGFLNLDLCLRERANAPARRLGRSRPTVDE